MPSNRYLFLLFFMGDLLLENLVCHSRKLTSCALCGLHITVRNWENLFRFCYLWFYQRLHSRNSWLTFPSSLLLTNRDNGLEIMVERVFFHRNEFSRVVLFEIGIMLIRL